MDTTREFVTALNRSKIVSPVTGYLLGGRRIDVDVAHFGPHKPYTCRPKTITKIFFQATATQLCDHLLCALAAIPP